MHKVRIAFLTTEYVTEATFDGGLANYLRRVSLALVERGHQVEIFTESDRDETLERDGILVHRLKPPIETINWIRRIIRYYYAHDAVKIPLFALKMRRRVMERHRQAPFDLIQVPNLESLGLALVHFSSIPMVVRASSYQPDLRRMDRIHPYRFSRSTRLIDRFERHMVRRAARIYAPSELIAEAYRQHVRADVDVMRPPFSRKHVSLDASVYETQLSGIRYLLYFGTLKVLKGGLVLGDALKLLLPRCSDLHMVLVGKDAAIKDDPQRTVMGYIRSQTADHADRVLHVTRLTHEQLYPIIEGAVGVVLPSRIDNLPNTCLEAMSFGKVVIGTRGASFDELIEDGVSGLLVPRDDPASLADAMERLWRMTESERQRIGAAALAQLTAFDPQQACQRLEAYFEDTLQVRRQRRK